MRSYRQFCGLARALDLIGERWTLLVVRELAIRPCRYTDLRDGLPGVATNLLADRLRALEQAGLVAAEHAPPPVATTLYRLTEHGARLVPILVDLARWGEPLMGPGRGDDAFRGRWLIFTILAVYRDVPAGDLAPLAIELDCGDGEPVIMEATDDGVRAAPRTTERADVRLRADADTLTDFIFGRLDPGSPPESCRVSGAGPAVARAAELIRRAPTAGGAGTAGTAALQNATSS